MKLTYFFVCGCGQRCENLKMGEYIRLKKNQKWVCRDCIVEEQLDKKEFKNGFIVTETDF